MLKDPFAALNLKREEIEALPDKEAQKIAITKAYRRAAKQHHPDRNLGDKIAIEKFKEATIAHDVLVDPSKLMENERSEWDMSWSLDRQSAEKSDDGEARTQADFWSSAFKANNFRHEWRYDIDDLSEKTRDWYDAISETTLNDLNSYVVNAPHHYDRDAGLLWALRRANEILGHIVDEDSSAPSFMQPPALFQFNRHNSEYSNNMGCENILYDLTNFKKRPTARSDTFTCDTLFTSDFITEIAPNCRAWANPFSNEPNKPAYITGRFKNDDQIGFVIGNFSNRDNRRVKKHFFTLVTPDIEHTQKALTLLFDRGLIARKHLQEMVQYGHGYKGLPGIMNEAAIDEPLLHMLETMLGIKPLSATEIASNRTTESPNRLR